MIYGSFEHGLEKFSRLPKAIKERLQTIKCHINYNQVWDFYQAHGQAATLEQLDREEHLATLHHGANDKFTMYYCGHAHSSFQAAQRCSRWQLILRGEKPKAERIIKNR